MSATSSSTMEDTRYSSWGRCGGSARQGRRGNWSPFNTTAMVLGFVFFWPIGLFLLYWIVTGREVRDLSGAVREQWSRLFGDSAGAGMHRRSGNSVFEDYQRTQYDRIREIKDEIVERSRRFADYRNDAKRRAEKDEFDRFMASAPERKDD